MVENFESHTEFETIHRSSGKFSGRFERRRTHNDGRKEEKNKRNLVKPGNPIRPVASRPARSRTRAKKTETNLDASETDGDETNQTVDAPSSRWQPKKRTVTSIGSMTRAEINKKKRMETHQIVCSNSEVQSEKKESCHGVFT